MLKNSPEDDICGGWGQIFIPVWLFTVTHALFVMSEWQHKYKAKYTNIMETRAVKQLIPLIALIIIIIKRQIIRRRNMA